MRIGIITYDRYHLKTKTVIEGLLKLGHNNIKILKTKFIKRKKRKTLFKHRPNQFVEDKFFKNAELSKIKTYKISKKHIKKCDYVLITGSNIIEQKFIVKNKIINCHSGLIPQTRGLDSLKWALLKQKLVGNTLHFIDKNIDSGKIISHSITPIFKNDNLNLIARRHYKLELFMLINFEKYFKKKIIYKLKKKEPSKRMKISDEKILIENFKILKKKIVKNQNLFLKRNKLYKR